MGLGLMWTLILAYIPSALKE